MASRYCVFCYIAAGEEEATVLKKFLEAGGCSYLLSLLVFGNKELLCFKDIYPAAPHHYLVVPLQHIPSCLSLHQGHVGLVKRMAEMGTEVLRDQGITDMNDIRCAVEHCLQTKTKCFIKHTSCCPCSPPLPHRHTCTTRLICEGTSGANGTWPGTKLGFHQPPYTSVDHLHLHVLAPSSKISKRMAYKFTPGTYRFITDEFLCKHLKDTDPPPNGSLLDYCCGEYHSSEESDCGSDFLSELDGVTWRENAFEEESECQSEKCGCCLQIVTLEK